MHTLNEERSSVDCYGLKCETVVDLTFLYLTNTFRTVAFQSYMVNVYIAAGFNILGLAVLVPAIVVFCAFRFEEFLLHSSTDLLYRPRTAAARTVGLRAPQTTMLAPF
jgi:hypothetical protein